MNMDIQRGEGWMAQAIDNSEIVQHAHCPILTLWGQAAVLVKALAPVHGDGSTGSWLLPLGHLPFPSPSFTSSDEGAGKCAKPSAFCLL